VKDILVTKIYSPATPFDCADERPEGNFIRSINQALRRHLGDISIVALYCVLLRPAWKENFGFYDDNSYSSLLQRHGLAWLRRSFHEQIGWYRFPSLQLQQVVWLLHDHFSLVRLVGGICHALTALLMGRCLRSAGFRLSSARVVQGGFLLFPYALEGVVWPTNAALYAGSLLISTALLCWTLSRPGGGWESRVSLVLLALTPTLHEQILGLMLLGVVAAVLLDRRRLRDGLCATLFGLVIFGLTIASPGAASARFSGADRPRIGNIFAHKQLLWSSYRRLTPFGDLFWSRGAFGNGWTYVAIVVALVLLVVLLSPIFQVQVATAGRPARCAVGLLAIIGGSCAFILSVAPGLAAGTPWFSPRYMYFPYVGLLVAAAGCVEWLSSICARAGTITAAFIVSVLVCWGSVATAAEAWAIGDQLARNEVRMAGLAAAVPPEMREVTDTIIVRGVPYTEEDRPLLGEHIVAITKPDPAAALHIATEKPPTARIDMSWNTDGLCINDLAQLEVNTGWLAANSGLWSNWAAGGDTVVAIWTNGNWLVLGNADLVPNEIIWEFAACIGASRPVFRSS
jgi:hypothetical protein